MRTAREGNGAAGVERGEAATAEGEGLPPDGHAPNDLAAAERRRGTRKPRPATAEERGGTQ